MRTSGVNRYRSRVPSVPPFLPRNKRTSQAERKTSVKEAFSFYRAILTSPILQRLASNRDIAEKVHSRPGSRLIEKTEAHILIGLLLICTIVSAYSVSSVSKLLTLNLLLLLGGLSGWSGGTSGGSSWGGTTSGTDVQEEVLNILTLKGLFHDVSIHVLRFISSPAALFVPWRKGWSRLARYQRPWRR